MISAIRREMDSLSKCGSLFSCLHFANTKTGFDENVEEIWGLLDDKHCLHKAHQADTGSVSKKAAYNNICKTVQSRRMDMQDSWMSKNAEEIQSLANRKDMKKFQRAPEPPHFLVQMEAHFRQIKMLH